MPTNPSIASSDHPCRLLDLPPELRLEIYEYVFYPLISAETVSNSDDNHQMMNEATHILLTSRDIPKDALDGYQKTIQVRIKRLTDCVDWVKAFLPGLEIGRRYLLETYQIRLARAEVILARWKDIERELVSGDGIAEAR